MSDINELFMQRRNEKVDPYGLTTKTMDGTEINLSETTPFATLIKDILQPMKSAQSSLNNKIDSLNSQNYPTNTDKELKDRIDQRISEHLMN